ncbi:unnamed protein product [Absidia cylindrospora]
MDSTWFDQPTYPMDDLNFSTAMNHLHQYQQQQQQQYHPHHPHHLYNFAPHRRAMSMQQTDSLLLQQQLNQHHHQIQQQQHQSHRFDHSKDTLDEFHHPPSSLVNSSDFTNNMMMNMDMFNTPTDVVPAWLLSNNTPSTTNESSCSSSPPPLVTTANSGNEPTSIKIEHDEGPPKKKRQKKNNLDSVISTTIDTSLPMPFLKQDDSTSTIPHQRQQSLSPSILAPEAIQSFVQRYLADRTGERTVMLLTSRVAQKSYGTEKRFLCPPPTTILSGSWCVQLPSSCSSSSSSPSSSSSSSLSSSPKSPATSSTQLQQPRLTIQISGEATQQTGSLEWSALPPPVLPSTLTTSNRSFLHSSSTVGKCVSKQLHINDADEKRKRVQVMVNIQLANNENIGTFASKGIKVISKPSKKRQSLKNIDLCIHHGTTISLFNRIRSQTVSTKYLGVSSQPSSASSSPTASSNSANNSCFVARTNVWDPFVIWIVDPQRTQQSSVPMQDTNSHYPPPPAMALHHTGKEQLAVHYNQPVVLQCVTTGLVSPILTIRKVDKGSLALSGAMVMDPTLSTTTEVLGDPVSQLHKVAFEIQSSPVATASPPPPSPSSHPYQIPPSSNTSANYSHQQQQQQRSIFLACLNDVVGRHKCHHPPQRVKSSVKNTASQQQQQQQDLSTPIPSSSGHGGRRRSSAVSSSPDQIDHAQGAYYEQDVSDAAVWTIVGTDSVRFTFAVPPLSDNANYYMRPEIAPFPVVASVSQGDATLCLWGEAFSANLTVYVGDHALATEIKSPEALVCVIPSSLLSRSSPDPGAMTPEFDKRQPILLVRKDGVIYKTDHFFSLKK